MPPKSAESLLQAARLLIAKQTGVRIEKILPSSRLEEDLRISGDDLVELVDELFAKLDIAPGDFSYARHGGPEGFTLLGGMTDKLLRRKPRENVPLRVSMFVAASLRGEWDSTDLLI